MTNPEELQEKFSGPSRTAQFGTVAVVVILVVAAALGTRPAWRGFKRWRAANFAAAAGKAADEGKLGVALQQAQAALQLEPQNPEHLRLNAHLLTEAASETSLKLWQNLISRADASVEDRFSYIEAALAFQRTDLVGPTLSNLTATTTPSARLYRLSALYGHGIGASNLAVAKARAAYRLEPSNATNALLVASLLANASAQSDISEARDLLREVADSASPIRLIAQKKLVQTDIGERIDRERICTNLTAKTPRSPAEEVLLAETRIRLDPATVGQTVSNLIAGIPHDDTVLWTLVVETLSRLGRHADVINLTPANRGLVNRTVFQARFDALVALGRAEEAYRLLLEPAAPVPAFELTFAKVKASVAAKDLERRDSHLLDLVRLCGENPTRLRAVAELAESYGALTIAADTWKELGAIAGYAGPSFRALQRLADRRGDTWAARDFARKAIRAGYSNTTVRLEIAYYNVLLAEDLERALSDAQICMAQQPRDFFARATVALGHLRLGEADKARSALERFFLEDPQPRPDALAVLAATFGENGFSIRAREVAARIPIDRLRPEERELIRPWLMAPTNLPGR